MTAAMALRTEPEAPRVATFVADLEGGLKIVEGPVEAFRQLAGLQTVVQGGLVRVGLAPGVELLVPFLVGFQTALCDLAGVGEGFLVNVEGLFGVVTEQLLEAGDGFGAHAWSHGRTGRWSCPGSAMRSGSGP